MTATYASLGLTMLATLLLEIVDSRLLSVVTWYHLSFVAISVAMLGAANHRLAGDALARFHGKHVVLYPHCDDAGHTAAKAWARHPRARRGRADDAGRPA